MPSKMVMYGLTDKILGSSWKKCQEADFHIKHTEPYYPWKLQAQGTIRDMKKGADRKMVRAGSPNKI